ncbi:zinc finger protein 423-like isoform X3 [Dreissena polymorpha]|uniref:Uncharacterized protein n=2 Tax=Dreissena polymorpha TaxID=45954 RepID=A0A9D4M270_DREPO|nr:zinc finger protein 423-like isoform X2 [Dreissena polymorpha]XP_052265355.1 zinc finger protein 423-like isoform X3 [Dreissena polymorpha]KAH3868928.1 hypothetical protein DPMN_032084 [Dreissena polymorpha]
MVKRCAWGRCKSDTRYEERLVGNVIFHPFPKPKRHLDRCLRWIKACGRPHDQLNVGKVDGNYNLYVCSKHFIDGAPSEEYPDPILAETIPGHDGLPRKWPASDPLKKKLKLWKRITNELVTMRSQDEYASMFRDILRCQIQTLLDQLSNAGEESVVITVSADRQAQTMGSEVGQKFLLENLAFGDPFLTYCLLNSVKKEPEVPRWSNKRKQEETNGDSNSNSDGFESVVQAPQKRQRTETLEAVEHHTSFTPTTPQKLPLLQMAELVKREATQSTPAMPVAQSPSMTSVYSDSPLPKGHSKCAICSYNSKFKANVTRHERKVHGLNADGVDTPTVEYVCALCSYRSSYRSNVMRHEKNVHKITSTALELERRKVVLNQPSAAGNQSMQADEEEEGNQSFLGSNMAASVDDESSRDNVEESGNDVADAEYHVCNYCQLVFVSLEQLKNHVDESHLGSEKFDCETCGEPFPSMLSLDSHVHKEHTLGKQEKCGCGKTFQYKMGLLRHARRCEQANIQLKDDGNGLETSMDTVTDGNGVQGAKSEHDEQSGFPTEDSDNHSDSGNCVDSQNVRVKKEEEQEVITSIDQADQSGKRFTSL